MAPPAEQPTFYYDLGSPYAWLAAERIHEVLPVVPVWQPILLGGIWQQTGGAPGHAPTARDEGMREVERRASEYGLLPVRWPDAWPTTRSRPCAPPPSPSRRAVRRLLARRVPAGVRGGKDLSDVDNVLIAAPPASSTRTRCSRASRCSPPRTACGRPTQEAYDRGVRGVPSVVVGDQVFWGDDRLEDAARCPSRARRRGLTPQPGGFHCATDGTGYSPAQWRRGRRARPGGNGDGAPPPT